MTTTTDMIKMKISPKIIIGVVAVTRTKRNSLLHCTAKGLENLMMISCYCYLPQM